MKRNLLAALLFLAAFAVGIAATGAVTHAQIYGSSTGTSGANATVTNAGATAGSSTAATPGAPNTGEKYGS